MPLTLIRRPRSPRVLHNIILDEVRKAYNDLADEMMAWLRRDIESWSQQPTFMKTVNVGRQRWFISIRYDKTTKIGEIYGWVDRGTGERGGGEAYDIFPVNADVLHFTVPNFPKTVATGFGPGIVLQSLGGEVTDVFTDHVVHPGIEPRNFTQSMKDYYYERTRPGGFRSVTERSIKRGARKIGI